MTCKLHDMTIYELIEFALKNANTPLERALLKHIKKPITTQRKLRIKFWNTHKHFRRRFGGWECQTTDAIEAWCKFVQCELNAGNISMYLATGATLAYQ